MTHPALKRTANVITLPPTILHELAHALVILPWAVQVAIVFDMTDADAVVQVNYRENVPRTAIVLSHYAPLLSGIGIGVLALQWLAIHTIPPATAQVWLWWSVLGVWWAIYTLPSAADRDTEVNDDGS